MSLCTTRGTSLGSFMRKATRRTSVPPTLALFAQGVAESSKALALSRRKRGRQSSFSSAALALLRAMSGSLSTCSGGACSGAWAWGVAPATSAKPAERFSDHLRVILRELLRCRRMETVLSSEGAGSGSSPAKSTDLGLASSSGGLPLSWPPAAAPLPMSRACIVGGGTRTPSSMSGTVQSQEERRSAGTPQRRSGEVSPRRSCQNSVSHSESPGMLSCSCRTENFLSAPSASEAVIRLFGRPAAGSDCASWAISRQGRKPVWKEKSSPAI
mmetsp:Transcript_36645/g.116634  ORF Transcript_36645/g.116634 Transcript_36645/m.116634 type:complete len:271 (-) Transcript_36645:440-1252(-)